MLNGYRMTTADRLDMACVAVVGALVLAPCVWAIVWSPPPPTFALLDFAPDGEVYARDAGLTHADCLRARDRGPAGRLACEPEA